MQTVPLADTQRRRQFIRNVAFDAIQFPLDTAGNVVDVSSNVAEEGAE